MTPPAVSPVEIGLILVGYTGIRDGGHGGGDGAGLAALDDRVLADGQHLTDLGFEGEQDSFGLLDTDAEGIAVGARPLAQVLVPA